MRCSSALSCDSADWPEGCGMSVSTRKGRKGCRGASEPETQHEQYPAACGADIGKVFGAGVGIHPGQVGLPVLRAPAQADAAVPVTFTEKVGEVVVADAGVDPQAGA